MRRECLASTGLLDWADRPAEALPLGQQRAVQVARALCGRPRLLLLDEPASGLRAAERERLAELIEELQGRGAHDAAGRARRGFVTRLADRITVLDLGQVIAEGTPAEIRADDAGGRRVPGHGGAGMIEVRDLVVRYGPATALDGVSLHVDAGEMVALIGPNGAGKSTLVNTLSGILKPGGRHRHPCAAGSRTCRRAGRCSATSPSRTTCASAAAGTGSGTPPRCTPSCPGLAELRHRRAGTLSGGEQQMVAVGRALMSRPDVLAVDELSLGLAPLVVADLVEHLRELNAQRGLAVLLIEQNARLALDLCTRAYVLEAGRIVAEGPSGELARTTRVAAAYLGGVVADAE